MNSPLLSLQDLAVTFKGAFPSYAVRGVNFDLYPGEVLGIVGESGSGKSAMVKAILQLLSPHKANLEGKILYQENDLLSLSEKQMQKIRGSKISMIFQDPMTSLNPTMKIGKQIVEGYLRHFPHTSKNKAKELAISLLERVGIQDAEKRFDAYPHTLSGGMRQRVMIALAIICHPEILIADEATTALDVTIQAQILHLLKDLQKSLKVSILFITHDLNVAAEFCDRILVMYAGKIVEEGPTISLFQNPQHPYTDLLLKARPKLSQSKEEPLIPILGTPPILTAPPQGCTFAPRCPYQEPACLKGEPSLLSLNDPLHKRACVRH